VAEMTAEQRKKKLHDAINHYVREEIEDPVYDCVKDELDSDITILWKDIKNQLIRILGSNQKWTPWWVDMKTIRNGISNVNVEYR
jgi:transcription elongation factor GreA-like protein